MAPNREQPRFEDDGEAIKKDLEEERVLERELDELEEEAEELEEDRARRIELRKRAERD